MKKFRGETAGLAIRPEYTKITTDRANWDNSRRLKTVAFFNSLTQITYSKNKSAVKHSITVLSISGVLMSSLVGQSNVSTFSSTANQNL